MLGGICGNVYTAKFQKNCYNGGVILNGYSFSSAESTTDCYCIEGTQQSGSSAIPLTKDQMKLPDFVTKLNTITTTTTTTDPATGEEVTTTTTTTQNVWVSDTKGINGGYPILSWQAQ